MPRYLQEKTIGTPRKWVACVADTVKWDSYSDSDSEGSEGRDNKTNLIQCPWL